MNIRLLSLGLVLVSVGLMRAADERVGVYDSRVVAFAHFWSEPVRQEREKLMADARAARDAGDKARSQELGGRLKQMQDRSHLEVFSTLPADEAMAALRERIPAVQRELGVTRLVSKWDRAALAQIPEAARVDATDRLVQEFKPDEKRQKTIAEMKKAKPVPLDRAQKMVRAGKM